MVEPSGLDPSAIKDQLGRAIDLLYAEQPDLLQNETNERSITHYLAIHLAAEFPGWHVDVEYNRMGTHPKRLKECVPETVSATSIDGGSIFPDLIVHRRGKEGPNVLVVEVKKSNNPDTSGDECKLKALTAPEAQLGFGYELGALVVLGSRRVKGLRWCAGGEELPDAP